MTNEKYVCCGCIYRQRAEARGQCWELQMSMYTCADVGSHRSKIAVPRGMESYLCLKAT